MQGRSLRQVCELKWPMQQARRVAVGLDHFVHRCNDAVGRRDGGASRPCDAPQRSSSQGCTRQHLEAECALHVVAECIAITDSQLTCDTLEDVVELVPRRVLQADWQLQAKPLVALLWQEARNLPQRHLAQECMLHARRCADYIQQRAVSMRAVTAGQVAAGEVAVQQAGQPPVVVIENATAAIYSWGCLLMARAMQIYLDERMAAALADGAAGLDLDANRSCDCMKMYTVCSERTGQCRSSDRQRMVGDHCALTWIFRVEAAQQLIRGVAQLVAVTGVRWRDEGTQ